MKTIEQTILVKVDEVKLVYQTNTPASQRAIVTCSVDAKNAFLDTWEEGTIEHHESFRILLLNRANLALGIAIGSNGGISGTVIDVRQVFITSTKEFSITQYFIPLFCTTLLKCNLLLRKKSGNFYLNMSNEGSFTPTGVGLPFHVQGLPEPLAWIGGSALLLSVPQHD